MSAERLWTRREVEHQHLFCKMVKYYTLEEVRFHNSADDCWLSISNKVYDITKLIDANRGLLANPLIEAAGTSISHWFSEKTGDVKTYMDPARNIVMPHTPLGRFIHVPAPNPQDNSPAVDLPWWKDPQYIIGQLTEKTRMIKIVNMVTRAEDVITVCHEETINDIRDRYMEYNAHAQSYTFKALIKDEFVCLDMKKTLDDNNVPDESDKFVDLNMDYDFYIPALHIYFNDDLTSL